MAVFVSNITIPVGSDFEQTFSLTNPNNTPLDLSGYSGSAALKKHPSSLTIAGVFDVSFPDRENGKVKISLASSITSYLRPGRYSYDVLIDSGNNKNRVVEGSAIITPGVTNPSIAEVSNNYPLNSRIIFEVVSDTQIKIKLKGADGVVRSSIINLTP
jgi:hypothetical protein